MTSDNAMEYACERRLLLSAPLRRARPRSAQTLDMRVAVNTDRARRQLDAVRVQGKRDERMVAFFPVRYCAAPRPEEAVDLRRKHLIHLPDGGRGEAPAPPNPAAAHGGPTAAGLATGDRSSTVHSAGAGPSGVGEPLRHHLDAFKIRLFIGPCGGVMTGRTYLGGWHKAGEKALSAQEAASPPAETPYALRHAAVPTWLSIGVLPARIAGWAGHSS